MLINNPGTTPIDSKSALTGGRQGRDTSFFTLLFASLFIFYFRDKIGQTFPIYEKTKKNEIAIEKALQEMIGKQQSSTDFLQSNSKQLFFPSFLVI